MVNDILEIKELSYSAGEKDILSDISFSVPRGGFLTIIGPNGAGKSTLLKCAGGLLPCRGGIFVEGRNIKGMSERERAKYIAWVHQGGSDRLPLSVRRFASLSRYPWRPVLAGESEEDSRAVKEALARAGVEALAERTLSSLSGGERQRALLAAALAQGTEILFLDEPTSFLDYRHQVEVMNLIERINAEGMTVIMVTHDINHALHASRDILALKDGKAVWRGAADSLPVASVLADIFETGFSFFRGDGQKRPYAAPSGFVS